MEKEVIKKYVWEAEPSACSKCQVLNGTEYQSANDVPDRPHPNCKCNVREVFDIHCDCWEEIDEIEELISDANMLKNNIFEILTELEDYVFNYVNTVNHEILRIIHDMNSLMHPLRTLGDTILVFLENYETMKRVNVINADKYYHSKANCQAAQSGILGTLIARGISDLREYTDDYRNINEKKYSLEASLKDILEDQEANFEGRSIGRKYPGGSCSEYLNHRIPNGLEKKDW